MTRLAKASGNNNVAHNIQIIASHIGETDGFDMSGNNK